MEKDRRKRRKQERVKIDYLNINGYTESKICEIEESLDHEEMQMICLVETHHQGRKYMFKDKWGVIEKQRKITDKKGGGLAIIYETNSFENVKQIDTKLDDIMAIEIRTGHKFFALMLVYWDVKDTTRNKMITEEMKRIIMGTNIPILIMGDFNAHLRHIDGRKNGNTDLMLELIESEGLIMINETDKAKGKYTWERNGVKTTIDYVLTTDGMSRMVEEMVIDEDKVMDISDHNKISVELKVNKGERNRKKEKIKKVYWDVKNANKLEKFAEECNKEVRKYQEITIDKMEDVMKKAANKYLKTILKINRDTRIRVYNKDIASAIKERRLVNRKKRKEKDSKIREELEEEYKKKKEKVKEVVAKVTREREEKESKWIMNNKSENIWKIIRNITEPANKEKEIRLCKNGSILSDEEGKNELIKFWKKIYDDGEEFDKDNQIKVIRDERTREEKHLHDHNYFKRNWIFNDYEDLRNNEIVNAIKGLKDKKAPGLSGIKAEMWKAVLKTMEADFLVGMFRKVMEGDMPKSWRECKVKMIPKTEGEYVEIDCFRPIAVTEISYKIMGSILKGRLIKFAEENKLFLEEQKGFTRNKRMEENLLHIQIATETAIKRKQKLYITSIDIKKAFDMVRRNSLVDTLKKLGLMRKMVDVIQRIYEHEETRIFIKEKEMGRVQRKRGIRQGCKMSPIIFVLLMNNVIKKINEIWKKRMNILMFADDTLLLADTELETVQKINVFKYECQKVGLEINENKSEILIINGKNKPENINGIRVVKDIKYLGIHITAERRMMKKYVKDKISKGQKYSNWMKYMLRSKLMKQSIGKSIWKGAILPALTHGMTAINLTKKEISSINQIQNNVYRGILEMPKRTPEEYLRGEIGSSSQKQRDREGKILLLKHVLENTVELKSELEKRNTKWMTQCIEYMEELKISMRKIEEMSKKELKCLCKRKNEEEWRKAMEKKGTLRYYRKWKKKMGKGRIWKSTKGDRILKLYQSGSVLTRTKTGRTEEDKKCKICDKMDDIEHMIGECKIYEEVRQRHKLVDINIEKVLFEDGEKYLEEIEKLRLKNYN